MSVDADRMLARLRRFAAIGATAEGGISRLSLTDADLEARALLGALITDAGFDHRIDAAANVYGRLPGSDLAAEALISGSHLDTVVNGGRYDGAYGVVAALEVLETLRDHDYLPRRTMEVVDFTDEEGTFLPTPMLGSRAASGVIGIAECQALTDDSERSERLRNAGGDPNRLLEARWNERAVAGFVELHVEQGPELESAGAKVGVVSQVNGRVLIRLTLIGRSDHAATVPHEFRRDALAGAAEITSWVEASAACGNLPRATVGRLQVVPNCANVVAGRVEMTIDLRGPSPDRLRDGRVEALRQVRAIAARRGLDVETTTTETSVAFAHERIRSTIREVVAKADVDHLDLESKAGHDAQNVSELVPMGMVFVPSSAGVSHAPDEHTCDADLVTGANVLLHTLVGLDQRWT